MEPGVVGLSDAGSHLTFSSPIAGVNAVAAVAVGGLAGGADEEADDALRARLIGRIQKPVSGGKKTDYEGWARSEEHTSELQSLMRNTYSVFCLKKKTKRIIPTRHSNNTYID